MHERGWNVPLSAGALGALMLASSTMLWIAFNEQWVSTSGYPALSHWEDGLSAGGWIALAAGSILLTLGTKWMGRPARIRPEPENRWWIREVLANRS
jgi:hypothetical protein